MSFDEWWRNDFKFSEEIGPTTFKAIARKAYEAGQASNKWQPIETAPRDGTVILTDDGTVKWGGEHGYTWLLCDLEGSVPSDCEFGMDISEKSPSVWMPLPKGPNDQLLYPEQSARSASETWNTRAEPTEVEIEAAAKAMSKEFDINNHNQVWETTAIAALKAAREVV